MKISSIGKAKNKVLSLRELLECILANLPERDLLLAQRVSQQWRDIIINSPLLQKQLFFQPTSIRPFFEEDQRVNLNPLIKILSPSFAKMETLPRCPNGHFRGHGDEHGEREMRSQTWFQSEERKKAFLRPEASWRRMFPSDPPPRLRRMTAHLLGCGCGSRETLRGRLGKDYWHLNSDPGARMGLIWDVIVFLLDDLPAGEFFLSWERKIKTGEDGRKRWTLEIDIETEHSWLCWAAEEAYKPSGLRVMEYDDLIEYKEYVGCKGNLRKSEAVPLSVQRRDIKAYHQPSAYW
ncbi:hypothetical protein BJY01DRAFT_264108 [Aspergillus pseudoustus]|uniref:F-box domain-containing protein n=1 Tax=Aspergillus pseudoustus TaxID=1810923 RepID=A0ABR4JV24_9EURO